MKPIVPREWRTTRAIYNANKKILVVHLPRGKRYPAFNGSQNNPRNKKRPITLPKV